jgi:integrase
MGVRLQERDGKGWYVIIHWKGQRRTKFFGKNKGLAKEFRDKLDAKLRLGGAGLPNKAGVKIETYAETWLDRIRCTRKSSTYEDYRKMLDRDLLPVLKGLDLEDVSREKVKALAFAGLKKGQSPKTVQNIIRCLSSLLSHAKEDDLIRENTALKPGKFLPKVSKRRHINPFTRDEVALFLKTAKQHAPCYYPLFLCAVRTGLRQGELLALQWGDLDFHGRFIEVQRNYAQRRLTTPKNGESRRVDMSKELCQTLRDLQTERQLEAAANGWQEVPVWIFCSETGGLLDPDNLRRRAFRSLLKASGLRRIRFHDLRHTFASLLLQQGESPVYVKEQMGHSSIQITVDLYGHLIPGGNKQAVDRLDGESFHAAKPEKCFLSVDTHSEEGRFSGATPYAGRKRAAFIQNRHPAAT